MKRFSFFVIFGAMVLALFGCGGEDNGVVDNGNIIAPGDTTVPGSGVQLPNRPVRLVDSLAARFDEFSEMVAGRDHLARMVFIESAGQTFTRGDFSLTDISRYEHQVSFSYNFYIDREEVTLLEYYVISGNPTALPPNFDVAEWRDLELPVGGLTFSDAILFLNKRSKFYGLDTVYMYDRVEDGVIRGLRADNTRNGFALPTQAEWEFVAKMYAYDYSRKRNLDFVFAGTSATAPRRASVMQSIGGFVNFFGNMREYCWSKMDDYLRLPSLVRDPDIHGLTFEVGDQVVRMGGAFTTSISQIHPSLRTSQDFEESGRVVIRHNGIRAVIRQNVGIVPDVPDPGDVDTIGGGVIDTIGGGDVDTIGGGVVDTIGGGDVDTIGGGVIDTIGGGDVDTIGGGVIDTIGGGDVDTIGGGVVDTIGGGVVDTIGGGVVDTIGGGDVDTIGGGVVDTASVGVVNVLGFFQTREEQIYKMMVFGRVIVKYKAKSDGVYEYC